MEEIKLTCNACGAEIMRLPKPAPQNAREGKQPRFHCEYCGAVNLRDGTIRTKRSLEVLEAPEKKKEESSISKVVVPIATVVLGVLAVIFLRKAIKGKGNGPGNISGGPGQSDRLPWNSIR